MIDAVRRSENLGREIRRYAEQFRAQGRRDRAGRGSAPYGNEAKHHELNVLHLRAAYFMENHLAGDDPDDGDDRRGA